MRALRSLLRAAGALLGLAALLVVVTTPLDTRGQLLFAGVVFALSLILSRVGGKLVTLTLAVVSVTVSTRYLVWRVTSTAASEWSIDVVFGGLLLAAELYAYAMLVLGYLQSVWPLERKPAPLPADQALWPTVDLFIPTYNEPLDVVRATVLAAKAIDWPADKLNVFVLDDGRREAFRAFAAEAGVGYLTRPDNKYAKAGNLNHALGKTRGELVAIFDCDHVPARSFLQTTVGWFLRDAKMALVQTPHHFYSPDPFERNLGLFKSAPNEGELFYSLIQPTTDVWNAAFFCGSCAVLRRTALMEVGGIAVETVTEDAHTALKMHRRGYTSAYIPITQAAGLATETLRAHVGQRIRWARGMAQIFRVDNPIFGRGLGLLQRLSYTAAMLHFFYGIPRLVFLIAPLSYPIFNLHIFNALPLMALAYGVPHLAHSVLATSRIQGAVRRSFWSEVYETCLSVYILIPTTLAVINPKLGRFNVTAKGGKIEDSYFERGVAWPYLVLTVLNGAGLMIGLTRLAAGVGERGVLLVNIGWSAYNLVILGGTLAVAWEQRQLRADPRVTAAIPAMLRLNQGGTIRCRTRDLSRGGVSLSVPPAVELARGQPLTLTILSGLLEVPLPAHVVQLDSGILRLRFEELTLEQESSLVQAMFSRADAWSTWTEGRERDKPLGSFSDIVLRGLGNVVEMLGLKNPKPALVAPPSAPAAALAIDVSTPPPSKPPRSAR
jgi:cellulose synthase (UDP-forming)